MATDSGSGAELKRRVLVLDILGLVGIGLTFAVAGTAVVLGLQLALGHRPSYLLAIPFGLLLAGFIEWRAARKVHLEPNPLRVIVFVIIATACWPFMYVGLGLMLGEKHPDWLHALMYAMMLPLLCVFLMLSCTVKLKPTRTIEDTDAS